MTLPQSSPEEMEAEFARRERLEREAMEGEGGILTYHHPAVRQQLLAIAAEHPRSIRRRRSNGNSSLPRSPGTSTRTVM